MGRVKGKMQLRTALVRFDVPLARLSLAVAWAGVNAE